MAYTYIDTNTITSSTATLTIDIASGYDEIVFQYHQYRGGASHGNGFGFQVETGSDSDYDKPMVTQNYGINSGYGYDWQSSEIYDSHSSTWGAWQHSSTQTFQAINLAGENETRNFPATPSQHFHDRREGTFFFFAGSLAPAAASAAFVFTLRLEATCLALHVAEGPEEEEAELAAFEVEAARPTSAW